jgi:hypothetical protein
MFDKIASPFSRTYGAQRGSPFGNPGGEAPGRRGAASQQSAIEPRSPCLFILAGAPTGCSPYRALSCASHVLQENGISEAGLFSRDWENEIVSLLGPRGAMSCSGQQARVEGRRREQPATRR